MKGTNNMKILVTGAAGFIGSNFVFYMLEKHEDYKITVLDSLTYAGNMETLKPIITDERFRFVRGDVADRDTVFSIFKEEEFDIVINFAAESHVDRSIEDPGVFLRTNILGTQVLMDACREFGVKRYHQVGTDEVYGDLPLDRPDLFFTEDMPITASSPYSASKASADLLVMAYHRTYGLPVTISRCSNNYGPYQFPEKLIPLIIARALEDKELPVYGTGENVRDWLYVEDHCSALYTVMTKGKLGETYNIGGNCEMQNIEIVKAICSILDKLRPKPDGSKYDSQITFVKDRPGHDRRYAIDASKIKRELRWEPKETFETGIRKTVKWYLENTEWVNDIITGKYQCQRLGLGGSCDDK